MTIEEAKNLSIKLEQDLKALIDNYCLATSLEVDKIDLTNNVLYTDSGGKYVTHRTVSVDIKL